MDILLKRNIGQRLIRIVGLIVSLATIIIILWTCALATDYIRFKLNNTPVFVMNSYIEYKENGYTSYYEGFGYTFVQDYEDSKYTNEFYVLNFKVDKEEVIYD